MNDLRRKLLGWMAASPVAALGLATAARADLPVLRTRYSGECNVYRFPKAQMIERLGKVEFDPAKQAVGKAPRPAWGGPRLEEVDDDAVIFFCDPLVLIYAETWDENRSINGLYHPDQRRRRMYVRWYDVEVDVVRMTLVERWGPANVLVPEKYQAITAALRQHVYGAA